MQENFDASLRLVLQHEGGWTDNPHDPGGATMKGVTLITYRRHFGANMDKDELRNISDEQLAAIYRSGYWDKCSCDALPAGLDYAVFDAAVNSGPGRSARWLQASAGAGQDGDIGPNTLDMVGQHPATELICGVCDERKHFLQGLENWKFFGKGWGHRIEQVRSSALSMAGGLDPALETPPPDSSFSIVRSGSTGEWVRRLQQALHINADGRFGPATGAALKQWQQDNGLVADGIAGRNSYRALGLIA